MSEITHLRTTVNKDKAFTYDRNTTSFYVPTKQILILLLGQNRKHKNDSDLIMSFLNTTDEYKMYSSLMSDDFPSIVGVDTDGTAVISKNSGNNFDDLAVDKDLAFNLGLDESDSRKYFIFKNTIVYTRLEGDSVPPNKEVTVRLDLDTHKFKPDVNLEQRIHTNNTVLNGFKWFEGLDEEGVIQVNRSATGYVSLDISEYDDTMMIRCLFDKENPEISLNGKQLKTDWFDYDREILTLEQYYRGIADSITPICAVLDEIERGGAELIIMPHRLFYEDVYVKLGDDYVQIELNTNRLPLIVVNDTQIPAIWSD